MNRSLMAAILLVACSPSHAPASRPPDEASDPSAGNHSASSTSPNPTPLSDDSCSEKIQAYMRGRQALNRCEHEDDCMQVWPGLCPSSPYFINEQANFEPIRALDQEIETRCRIPNCEPPPYLRPAGCQNGLCVAGTRTPMPPETPVESCWDTRVQNIENQGAADGELVTTTVSSTPRMVYGVPASGQLTITAQWPHECADCQLQIAPPRGGRSTGIEAQHARHGDTETITLPVTAGAYEFVGNSTQSSGERFRIRVRQVTPSGETPPASRHGFGFRRGCEG